MTRITTYRCDVCSAVLEGSVGELRESGKGWRFLSTLVAALTGDDIEYLQKAGEIKKDYCPKCVPDWVATQNPGPNSYST